MHPEHPQETSWQTTHSANSSRALIFCRGWSRTPARPCQASANGSRPRFNPEELGKRIEELRTVQFWLEQNGRMLGATIQALEVQRMTLSTLQSMNVPLGPSSAMR